MATNVFDLFARLSLDDSEYKNGLSKAASLAGSAGGAIGKGLATAAKIGTAALTATTTAVTAVGTAAIKSYANYEQLAGGVEKLYDTAADKVKAYADKAYATSGMSANQYMETATSFSAALIKSLGDDYDKAADMTDVAMQAISDNVNVFGSDMASVENAFQGFAKQNYTMLDNLKLGYGGTKEGMEQLIADANEWAVANNKAADLSIDSFADVVTAIDYIQQKQGIAGTTAAEAMRTIEGSANATKSAWQNVITAIGRGEGLSEAFDGLITSLFGTSSDTGFVNQITKRVEIVMESIGDFISKASPYITEKVPELIKGILPSLLKGGVELLSALGQGFMDALPDLLFTVGDIMESILETMVKATSNSGGTIVEIIDWILGVFEENYMNFIDMGLEIITNILEGFSKSENVISYSVGEIIKWLGNALIEYAPQIITAGTEIITNLINGISELLPTLIPIAVEVIMAIVNGLITNIPLIIDCAIQLINGLATGLINALPVLIAALPTIITSLVNALIQSIPLLIDGAEQLILGIVGALPEIITALVDAIPLIIDSLISGFLTALPQLIEGGVQLVIALVAALPQIIQALVDAIPQIITTLVNTIVSNGPQFFQAVISIGQSILQLIINLGTQLLSNVKDNMSKLIDTVKTWLSQLPQKMAYYAGQAVAQFINKLIALPSKIIQIFTNIINNVKSFGSNMQQNAMTIAREFGDRLITGLKELPQKMLDIGKNIVEGLKNGISNAWNALTGWVKDLCDNLVKGFTQNLKIKSPSRVFRDEVGKWIPLGIAEGITENAKVLYNTIDEITSNMIPSVDMAIGNVGSTSGIRIASNGNGSTGAESPINVYVTLEGDANRLFRVVQAEANRNYQLVGKTVMVTG